MSLSQGRNKKSVTKGVIRLKDENYYNSVNQVDTVEEAEEHLNRLWGKRRYVLTSEDVIHLIRGGYLAFDDGEYATVLRLED